MQDCIMNNIPSRSAHTRLIIALDCHNYDAAELLITRLGQSVETYKIGLELLMSGEFFKVVELLHELGKEIFADIKFFDVPATVARAVRRLSQWGITFASVHGNQTMMEAANQEKGNMRILAVTALTSLDQGDLEDLGFTCTIREIVISRARRAIEAGLDGVVASGHEIKELRETLGTRFLIVTPGIRPISNTAEDDQKRVISAREALEAGADYLVVGRPVRDALDPPQAAQALQKEITEYFARV
ncbi:orotidine 5'-phosphate decarboxylase [mine drainage metagenome]|uniref:Orotidine 5'-phosphate decarboxylase n=2 Tax=mine drainage metagenome TaxID=410659 RepID=T1AAV3_9ZZZZ